MSKNRFYPFDSVKIYRFIAFTCIVVGFLSVGVIWHQNTYVHPMQWNEVGDYLGGTMVGFWSLAGLFFIYVAFLGQRLDIQLTKQELSETREIQAKQASTLSKQQFENLFFNMIDTHLKIVEDLDTSFSYGGDTYKGRDVFYMAFAHKIKSLPESKKRIQSYKELYNSKSTEFGHYYRFLYRIISRVDKQEFIPITNFDYTDNPSRDHALYNFEVRYEYTSIVRSLLSDEELELLFLNMLHFKDLKFKALIEKYCLLKNIPYRYMKIDNKEYDFDPGAIDKNKNLYIIELEKLKRESQVNR